MNVESQLVVNIAKNIQNLRKQRNLTQEMLSIAADVPRSTITHIESGEANPTITVVEKIASGLQVSIGELLVKPRGEHQLIRANEIPQVDKSGGKAIQYKLLPDKIRGMEIDRLELKSGFRMKGVPHVAHTKEYLTCIKGSIEVATGGQKFLLMAGDVLAFPGDLPHSYYNPSREISISISVVALAF